MVKLDEQTSMIRFSDFLLQVIYVNYTFQGIIQNYFVHGELETIFCAVPIGVITK